MTGHARTSLHIAQKAIVVRLQHQTDGNAQKRRPAVIDIYLGEGVKSVMVMTTTHRPRHGTLSYA